MTMTNTELKPQSKASKSSANQVKKLIKTAASIALLLNLTACATYDRDFKCGDSKGVYCAPMDRVDQMINSGEIERFNEQRQKQQKYKPLKNSDTPKLKEKQEPIEVASVTNVNTNTNTTNTDIEIKSQNQKNSEVSNAGI